MSESSHGLQEPISTQQTPPLAAVWLSVLIPVYNVQAYLRECVESVMQQLQGLADGQVEVLLLNDASTDASAQLAEQLRQQWPGTIQLITHAHNQGLSAARNTLLEHAAGEYVWFLDSDDCLEPGAMAALQRVVQSGQPDVVLCDFRLWRAQEKLKHRLRGERHRHSFDVPKTLRANASVSGADDAGRAGLVRDRAALLEGLFLSGQMHAWSKISKRALWQASAEQAALRFPVGMAFEDMATMPCLLLRAHSFVYVPEVWVAYRQRAGSILASMNRQKALDLGASLDAFARAYQRQAQAEPALASAAVRFAIAHLAARNYLGALRALARSPEEGTAQAQAGLAHAFLHNSPLTAAQLLQQYLQRGWLARYWRARAALRGWPTKHLHG